jgi:hypothetical protein
MCRFHRPDPLSQPIHQRAIVRVASKECLAKMNVSLNESRENEPTARVDRLVVTAEQIGSDCGDPSIRRRLR